MPEWQANRTLTQDKRPQNTPALDKARVLELLAENPGATKRDLAQLLGLKGSDRILLKRMLKELEAEGAIDGTHEDAASPGAANCRKSRCSKSPASTPTANCWPGR